MKIEWRRMPLFYAALIFSAAIFFQNTFFPDFPKPSKNHVLWQAKKEAAVTILGGQIASEVETREGDFHQRHVSFVLDAKRIWSESGSGFDASGKVRVTLTDPLITPAYGDEIVLKGELREPTSLRNPGGFDARAYLAGQGIRAVFYADKKSPFKILRRHCGNFLQEKALEAKRFLSAKLSEAFDPRDAGFLKALFLGERGDIDGDFKDLFIKTGTMHILAVSGFNIGFLSLSLFLLLGPFRVPRNLKFSILLVAIWLYCLLVGWQAPLVRASLMATVLIAGELLGRKAKILNSLGFAALVILAVNPSQLFDVGFQLSFLAVFAIAFFLPTFVHRPELLPNERRTAGEKIRQYAEELFWISFVCSVVTLPVTAQNFYMVAPLSLLANMLVVPLSFVLFFTGVLYFLTFWWVPSFLPVIPWAVKLLMQLFVAGLFAIENLPGAYFIVGKLHPFLWALLTVGIFYFLLDSRIRSAAARALVLVFFILNVFLAEALVRHFHEDFRMTVLDVGQGDSIYFEFPGGGNLLIDAGKGGEGDRGRRVVAPFLKSKGVSKLDAVVFSHPQEDHVGGMPALLDEFRVKHVLQAGSTLPTGLFKTLQEKVALEKCSSWVVTRGDRVKGFKDVEISVLHPSTVNPASKNINNDSVVLKIQYGRTSFLLTGDIEKEAMAEILNGVGAGRGSFLQSTVFKVPHHGAKMNSVGKDFVEAVRPQISVISVGKRNPFHQPSADTLNILSSLPHHQVLRTDQKGAIEITSDGLQVRLLDDKAALPYHKTRYDSFF